MTQNDLASYVRSAAEQRRWLIPRRRDRILVARGGALLHAIDTDIVKLYTNPWVVAPNTKRRKGYAEIFPDEDPQIVIALGEALAKFIFHQLSGDLPLVILPPMGEEVDDVFTAVSRDAEQEVVKVLEGFDAFKGLVHQSVSMSDTDPAKAAEMLAEHASQISLFLLGQKGANAELRRFGLLLREARIAPPEYLIDNRMVDDTVLRVALEPPTDLADRLRFRLLREAWFDRLRKKKGMPHDTVLIESDAQVLARLEWINSKLILSEAEKGATHRVVLITGDHAMYAAAEEVCWGRSEHSFAELFLRHPRAYLAEPGVLAPPEDADQMWPSTSVDTQFDQWLDTWLGELNPGTDDFGGSLDKLLNKSERELEEWVAPLIHSRPHIKAKLTQAWSSYTRNLVLDRQQSSIAIQLTTARERGVVEEYVKVIEQLKEAIDTRIRETWEDCFSVAAEGGYSLLSARLNRASSTDDIPSRTPPMLVFDRLSATSNFIEQVLRGFKAGGLTAAQWDEALRQLNKEDSSGYAFFLGLGFFFAADNRWRVSAILASRALAIAERDKPERVSGREAAFLRAVALRHSARSVTDLSAIVKLLDQAEAAYERDRANYAPLKAAPCRFNAERLALFITYHLHRTMLKARIPDSIPSLGSIQGKLVEAIDILRTSEERENVVLSIERSLLTSWYMTVLLRFTDEDMPLPITDCAVYLGALEDNILRIGGGLVPSFCVETIRKIGTLLLAKDQGRKNAARKDVLEWLSQKNIDLHSVMRYDAERFWFLKKLAEDRIL